MKIFLLSIKENIERKMKCEASITRIVLNELRRWHEVNEGKILVSNV